VTAGAGATPPPPPLPCRMAAPLWTWPGHGAGQRSCRHWRSMRCSPPLLLLPAHLASRAASRVRRPRSTGADGLSGRGCTAHYAWTAARCAHCIAPLRRGLMRGTRCVSHDSPGLRLPRGAAAPLQPSRRTLRAARRPLCGAQASTLLGSRRCDGSGRPPGGGAGAGPLACVSQAASGRRAPLHGPTMRRLRAQGRAAALVRHLGGRVAPLPACLMHSA